MTKAAIPIPRTGSQEMDRFVSSVKQNLDAITGQARNAEKIAPLPADATLEQVVQRINLIVERLQ